MSDCLKLTGHEIKDGKIVKITDTKISGTKILSTDPGKLSPLTENSSERDTESKPASFIDKLKNVGSKSLEYGNVTFLAGMVGYTIYDIYKTAGKEGRDPAVLQTLEVIGDFALDIVTEELIFEPFVETALQLGVNRLTGSAATAAASETFSAAFANQAITRASTSALLRASVQNSVRSLLIRIVPSFMSQLVPAEMVALSINPILAGVFNAALLLSAIGYALFEFLDVYFTMQKENALREEYKAFIDTAITRENTIEENFNTAEIQLQIAISNNLYVVLQRNAVIPDGSNAYYITTNYVGILDTAINSYVFYYWKDISTRDMVNVVNNNNNKGVYVFSPSVRSIIYNYFLQNQYYTDAELIKNTSLSKNDPYYNSLIPTYEEYYRIRLMQQINGNDMGLDTIKFFYSSTSYMWSYLIYPPININQSFYFPTTGSTYGSSSFSPTINYPYYFLNPALQEKIIGPLNTFYTQFQLICGIPIPTSGSNPYDNKVNPLYINKDIIYKNTNGNNKYPNNSNLQSPYTLINLAKQLINCLPILSKFNFESIDSIFLPAFIDFCNQVYSTYRLNGATNDKSIIGMFITHAVKFTDTVTSDSPSVLKNVKYIVECYTFNTKGHYDQLFVPITQFYKNFINDSRISPYHYPISIETLLNYSYMFHFLGLNNLYNLRNISGNSAFFNASKANAMNIMATYIYNITDANLINSGISVDVPHGPKFFTSDMQTQLKNYLAATMDPGNGSRFTDNGDGTRTTYDPCANFTTLPNSTGLTSDTAPPNTFTSYNSLPLTSPMINNSNIDENGMVFNLDSFSKIYDQILQVVQKSNFMGGSDSSMLSQGISDDIINILKINLASPTAGLLSVDTYYKYFLQLFTSVLKQMCGYDVSSGTFSDIINILYGVNPFNNFEGGMVIQPFFTNYGTGTPVSSATPIPKYNLSNIVGSPDGNTLSCFNNNGVATPVVNAIIPNDKSKGDSESLIDIPGSSASISNGGLTYTNTLNSTGTNSNGIYLTNNFYVSSMCAFYTPCSRIGNIDNINQVAYGLKGPSWATLSSLAEYYKTLCYHNSYSQFNKDSSRVIDYSQLASNITQNGKTNKLMNIQSILSVTNLFSSILLIMMFNDTGFAMNLMGFFGNVANYWNGIFDENTNAGFSKNNYIYKYADIWFASVLGMNPPHVVGNVVNVPNPNRRPILQNILINSSSSSGDFSSKYFTGTACGIDTSSMISSTTTPTRSIITTTNVINGGFMVKTIKTLTYSNTDNSLVYNKDTVYNVNLSNTYTDPITNEEITIEDINTTTQNQYKYDGSIVTIALLTGIAENINGCIGFSIARSDRLVTFYYFNSLPSLNNASVYNGANITSTSTQSLYDIKQDPGILFTCFSLFPIYKDSVKGIVNLFNNGATQQILLINTINNFILKNNANKNSTVLKSTDSSGTYPFRSISTNLPASLLFDKRINYKIMLNTGFAPTGLINPYTSYGTITPTQLQQIIKFFNCNKPGYELADYQTYQNNGYLTRIPNTPILPAEIVAYSRMAYINTFLDFFVNYWKTNINNSNGPTYTSRILLANSSITDSTVINYLSWFVNTLYHGNNLYYYIQSYTGPYVNSLQDAIGTNNFNFSSFLTTGFSINTQSSTVTFYKISKEDPLKRLTGLYIHASDYPVNVTEYSAQLYLLSAISDLQTYKNSLVTGVFANIFTNSVLYVNNSKSQGDYYGGLLYNVYPSNINKYSPNDRYYQTYATTAYTVFTQVQPDSTYIIPTTFDRTKVSLGNDNANIAYCMYIADTTVLYNNVYTIYCSGFFYDSSKPENTTFYKSNFSGTPQTTWVHTKMNVWSNKTAPGVFYDRAYINNIYLPAQLSTQSVPKGVENKITLNLTFTELSNNYKPTTVDIGGGVQGITGMIGINPNIDSGTIKPIWCIFITKNNDNLKVGDLLVIGSDYRFYVFPSPPDMNGAPKILTYVNSFVANARVDSLNIKQIIILPDRRYLGVAMNSLQPICYIFNTLYSPTNPTKIAIDYHFPFVYNNYIFMSSTNNNTIVAINVNNTSKLYTGYRAVLNAIIITLTVNTAWNDYNNSVLATSSIKLIQPNLPFPAATSGDPWIIVFTTDGNGNFIIGLNNTKTGFLFNSYSQNLPNYETALFSVPIDMSAFGFVFMSGIITTSTNQPILQNNPGLNLDAPSLWYFKRNDLKYERDLFRKEVVLGIDDTFNQISYVQPQTNNGLSSFIITAGGKISYAYQSIYSASNYTASSNNNYNYLFETINNNQLFKSGSQKLNVIKFYPLEIRVPLASILANPVVSVQVANPYATYKNPPVITIPGFTENESNIIFKLRRSYVNLNNNLNQTYFLTFVKEWADLNIQFKQIINCIKATSTINTSSKKYCTKIDSNGNEVTFLNILNIYPYITNISTLFYSSDFSNWNITQFSNWNITNFGNANFNNISLYFTNIIQLSSNVTINGTLLSSGVYLAINVADNNLYYCTNVLSSTSWIYLTTNQPSELFFVSITQINSDILSILSDGNVYTSTWVKNTDLNSFIFITSVDSSLVCIDTYNNLWISSDRKTFTQITTSGLFISINQKSDKTFVCVQTDNNIYISSSTSINNAMVWIKINSDFMFTNVIQINTGYLGIGIKKSEIISKKYYQEPLDISNAIVLGTKLLLNQTFSKLNNPANKYNPESSSFQNNYNNSTYDMQTYPQYKFNMNNLENIDEENAKKIGSLLFTQINGIFNTLSSGSSSSSSSS